MMANENEIIPVLHEDEDDSDLEEMLELITDEDKGNPEKPTLEQQLACFRQEWQLELGKVTREPGDSRGSPAPRGSPALQNSPAPQGSPSLRVSPAPRGSPSSGLGQRVDAASALVSRPEQKIDAVTASVSRSEHRLDAASTPVKGPEQRIDTVTAPVKSSGDTTSSSRSPSPQSEDERDVKISSLSTESVEEKAKYLFKQGVKHERNGRMYDAVMFYKQAIQLVPDVESRVQESEGNSYTGSNQVSDDEENNNNEVEDMKNNNSEVEEMTNNNSEVEEMTDDSVDEIDTLSIKLQLMTTNDLRTSCSPKTTQTATHISALPTEVLLYIFRWVVTSNLDLRSLEQLSMVCRGFYVCCRDSEIWRKACVRMWGKMSYLMKEYVSWREMYVHRAHPHFNGVYISRVTYIRQGEPSMDPFYKPWHLVEYHRFLRVFADGTIMLANSSDEPQSIVSKMHKNYFLPGRMIGRFCINGDVLTAVLEKEKVKESDTSRRYMRYRTTQQNLPESEQRFELELGITSFGRKPNMKLEWKRYACHTRYRSTGNENTTEFDMNHQFYPFYFSRVKSYARAAEAPL